MFEDKYKIVSSQNGNGYEPLKRKWYCPGGWYSLGVYTQNGLSLETARERIKDNKRKHKDIKDKHYKEVIKTYDKLHTKIILALLGSIGAYFGLPYITIIIAPIIITLLSFVLMVCLISVLTVAFSRISKIKENIYYFLLDSPVGLMVVAFSIFCFLVGFKDYADTNIMTHQYLFNQLISLFN